MVTEKIVQRKEMLFPHASPAILKREINYD